MRPDMGEVTLPAPVKATNVPFQEGWHDLFDAGDAGRVPGAFNCDGEDFSFCCPCGCRNVFTLRAAIGAKPARSPSWNFNGDSEKPTLYPSVHIVGHWHGW